MRGMCMNCVTSTEAVVINGVGFLALAQAGLDRVRDFVAGRSSTERRAAAWDANAQFVRSIGLDPAAVLPARPVVEPGRAPVFAPAAVVQGQPALA